MIKVTPGPWRAVRRVVSTCYPWGEPAYTSYASFVEPIGLQVYGPDWHHDRRHNGPESNYIAANARLIAAAPRMYAFIEFCAAAGNAEAKAIKAEIEGAE